MPTLDPQTFSDNIAIISFLIERFEFFIGLLLGSGATTSYFVTMKKNIVKSSAEGERAQALSVVDSHGAKVNAAQGDVVGGDKVQAYKSSVISVGSINGSPNMSLTLNQVNQGIDSTHLPEGSRWCMKKLCDRILERDQWDGFNARYVAGYNQMTGTQTKTAASEYLGAWLMAGTKVTKRDSYMNDVDQDAQASFRAAILSLSAFVSNGESDRAKLISIVNSLEDSFLKLEPYLL